jgi:hypothetical protein
MESIKIRRHVGLDGILHLDIPVGMVEKELEIVIIYQPITLDQIVHKENPSSLEVSLESLYGICADDPIIL